MRTSAVFLCLVALITHTVDAKGGGGGGGGSSRSVAAGAGFAAATRGGRGTSYSSRRRAAVSQGGQNTPAAGTYPPAYYGGSAGTSAINRQRMAVAGLGFIVVTARRRYYNDYYTQTHRRRAPAVPVMDASAALRPCRVTLFEHGFNADTPGVREGLPPVVVLEGSSSETDSSKWGQETADVKKTAGRVWSTNVTGQWVSPPPDAMMVNEASALMIEGNCTLLASPYPGGAYPDNGSAYAFDHVWQGPGTWSCGLEADEPGTGTSRRRAGKSYTPAYQECGTCLATGNDNIFAVRLDKLDGASNAAAQQACPDGAARQALSEIAASPATRRRRSLPTVCPCNEDSCGGGGGGGADWGGAVGGLFTVFAIITGVHIWRKTQRAQQQNRVHSQQQRQQQALPQQQAAPLQQWQQQAMPQAQPVQPVQQMQVQVPQGVQEGQQFMVQTPAGQLLSVVAPPGVPPGGTILVPLQPQALALQPAQQQAKVL